MEVLRVELAVLGAQFLEFGAPIVLESGLLADHFLEMVDGFFQFTYLVVVLLVVGSQLSPARSDLLLTLSSPSLQLTQSQALLLYLDFASSHLSLKLLVAVFFQLLLGLSIVTSQVGLTQLRHESFALGPKSV